MTILDFLLITVGLTIMIFSAMHGLIQVLIMFFSFYIICIAAGIMTLAAEVVQKLATTVTTVFGGAPPPLAMAQLMVFLCVGIPLFIASYFLSKAAFGDTTIPELKGFDNVLGAGVGVILALLVMAVMCNTWGVAVNAPRRMTPFWLAMKNAYYYAALRPMMTQIIGVYQMLLFVFRFLDYPPFFVPQWM